MTDKLLKGKNAVVTGAAAGIGEAIARTFAAEGAGVAIWDVDGELAEKTAEAIRATGALARSYKADVSDWDSVKNTAQEILEEFEIIDALVNNAGITSDNLLVRMSDEQWKRVLDVNLKGAFHCTKAFVPGMLRRRSGKIISIASVVGMMGNVGQANYAASKAGLIGLTKSLARELASRSICVNAIAPGFIKTRMTEGLSEAQKTALAQQIPLARLGEVGDIARAALFLASDMSNYITGQTLVVDGGMIM
jgi:3-oxoacyl-[acyl-carrier protein] reductase